MKREQPALPNYYLHDGFVEMKNVVMKSFQYCGENITANSEKVKEATAEMEANPSTKAFDLGKLFGDIPARFKWSFHLSQLVFSAVITPLIVACITLCQIAILVVLYMIAAIIFGIMILADKIYCYIKSISNQCPNCQSKFSLPSYLCPCGLEHDLLTPGKYGIFKRECNCGNLLPTTFLNGREKLQAKCPECGHSISEGGLQSSWCIPVVGGPSSGKTCYINMTMMSLQNISESKYGLIFDYEDNGLDDYKLNSNKLINCQLPAKTADKRLKYYQFSLTPEGATKQLISLCDVAGELFNTNISGNEMTTQIGFHYANAFILIIDPLAITQYRDELSKTHKIDEYFGSQQPIDDLADILIVTLQKMFSLKSNAFLKSEVAIVFTKMDLPGLSEQIGESAVQKVAQSSDLKSLYKAQNALCEQFLLKYNEHNFLKIMSQFKNVQYFVCSSLGHIENGQPFEAMNVEEPFFYLLQKTSKVIDKAIKEKNINGD